MTAPLKLLKYSLIFIPLMCFSQTKRTIMENTPASNDTILISTNNKSVAIATTNTAGYTLNVLGSINTTGYFLNGMPFSGSSGDNLGSHIATMTLNMSGYPLINSSTIYSNILISTKSYLSGNVVGKQEYGFNNTNLANCNIIQNMSGYASISGCNNLYTTNNVPADFYGDYGDFFTISVSSYNFNIPTNAIIKGIEVKLIGKTTSDVNPPAFYDCYLLKNGSNYGNDKCTLEYFFTSTTTYTEYTLGSSTYLWGGVWTSTDINNNGFGFYTFFSTRSGLKHLYIDSITIKVYYSLPYWEFSYDSNNNLSVNDGNNNFLKISTDGYVSNKYGILLTSNTDTMGNHTATTTLNMNNNSIINASSISASNFYGNGSNLTNLPQDNLGNHIATMTLTTNYGINSSTIQAKNMLVYDGSSQPYINIMSVNYLNSPEIRFSTIATNSSWSIGNINTWNDALAFRQRGLNEKMILTQDGKLSIGVNPTPTEKLEVDGNIKANSFMNTTAGTTNYIVVSTALYAMNGGSGSGSGGYTSFVIDDFTSQTNGSQTQFTLSHN